MSSIAYDYKMKVMREEAAKTAETALVQKEEKAIKNLAADQGRYNLLDHSLNRDLILVSSLPLGEGRNILKRNELIPKYRPYIDEYLKQNSPHRNKILVQVMIWAFDAGDIDYALKLSDVVLQEKQSMPKRFKRKSNAYIADAFLEWCQMQIAHSDPVEPYFSKMFERILDWKIHDIIKMKYYKFSGELLEGKGKRKDALECYQNAYRLCPLRAKVKTKIEKLSRKS